MWTVQIDPLVAVGVVLATASTDAVYVAFTSAVVARRRLPAATWSSIWYLLSSYAVISYTENWAYVAFAALGSWLGWLGVVLGVASLATVAFFGLFAWMAWIVVASIAS